MKGQGTMTGGEWKVIAISGGLASAARLGVLLREGKITPAKAMRWALLSIFQGGVAGVAIALLLHDRFQDREALLCGISLIAGIGGVSLLEMLYGFGVAAMKQLAVDTLKEGGKDK